MIKKSLPAAKGKMQHLLNAVACSFTTTTDAYALAKMLGVSWSTKMLGGAKQPDKPKVAKRHK